MVFDRDCVCRWEEIGGEKIVEFPRVEAPNGYHIKVMKL